MITSILYAKIHDKNINNIKNNILVIGDNLNYLKKIMLNNTWKKLKITLPRRYKYWINGKNVDIKIEQLNSSVEWTVNCYSLAANNFIDADIKCMCNTVYTDNFTCNNFSKLSPVNGYFQDAKEIICKMPFKLDSECSDEIFKGYNGTYISNNFEITDNVRRINGLFSRSNIKAVPTNFKITKNFIDINNIFSDCKNLRQISGVIGTFSKKRFPNMITPKYMFNKCKNLKDIPIKFFKKDYINEKDKLSTNFIGLLSYVHEL